MRKYLLILLLYPAIVHSQNDSITVKVPIGDPTGIAPMGTRFMTLAQPSAVRYLKIEANNDLSLRTAAQVLSDIGAQASGTYLAPDGNGSALTGLTKGQVGLGSVENTALSTWAGTSNVTTLGTIGTGTWNATAIADGKIASALTGKTYNGLTVTSSTGTLTIANGKTATVNNTVTITGTDGVTTNFPPVAGTVMLNTSTSGVGTSPTASSTVTITHNLGRVPTIIRIYGSGTFTSNAAATATTHSMGTFNSTGNRCIYQGYNTAAITTTQASLSSSTFALALYTGANSFITGVIQNVTSTQFDIVFTETGTATAQVYLWEAQ